MDPAKATFLFGTVPEGFDLDDPDDRAELLTDDWGDRLTDAGSVMRAVVVEQILADEPPAVWATAERLLGLGVSREQAMAQLVMAFTDTARSALEDEGVPFDTDAYAAALATLPLPSLKEIEAAALAILAGGAPVGADELDEGILARLGRAASDPLAMLIVDRVLDRLTEDDGPVALLAGDRLVHVGDVTAGIVLTHRLSPAERDLDVLPADFDLAGFARRTGLRLAGGTTLETVDLDGGGRGWQGPAGWLHGYEEGVLLGVRATPDGVVALDLLTEEPAIDASLVELLRSVYDDEVAEPWLPVPAEDLVLGVLLGALHAFSHPQPPLEDLCAAAGLERRGRFVAHEDSVWASQEHVWRLHRVFDAFDDEQERRTALRVLEVADSNDPSLSELRQALADLQDTAVAEVVLTELDSEGRAESFSEALLGAATTSRQIGVARWLAAVVAEAQGDVEAAEAHLHIGLVADPGSGALVERCAWYASDRGRAREAVALWHRLGGRRAADIETVEPFARRSGPKLGRNDPCWCGSGRKYKICHNGQEPRTSLPDRVGWLCRKGTAYLEHGGDEARSLIGALARRRATGLEEDDILDAIADPIVVDAALTEGGWFARFVEDRGRLLPDDEALLAQSWLLLPRTVYEVLDVTPGAALRARDLRTGDVVDVRERTYTRDARAGELVCGRAVPDGQAHQFVGALFPVAPGTEAAVLELCESEDPEALCDHVGSLHRPPELRTREGERLVACTAELEMPDPDAARTVLDRHYRREGEAWVEMSPIGENEEILRATLTIEGSRLLVRTHSEPRLDRVLTLLREVLPDASVVSDQRVPLAPGELPTPPLPALGDPSGPDAVAEIQELLERRWLDESVPALAGMSPREAAIDPTRREELRRLIASFPSADGLPEGALTMRPHRLRQMLDL